MGVYAFNPSSWEEETSGSLLIRGQPESHSKFWASQGYIVRPCLITNKLERKSNLKQKLGVVVDGVLGRWRLRTLVVLAEG